MSRSGFELSLSSGSSTIFFNLSSSVLPSPSVLFSVGVVGISVESVGCGVWGNVDSPSNVTSNKRLPKSLQFKWVYEWTCKSKKIIFAFRKPYICYNINTKERQLTPFRKFFNLPHSKVLETERIWLYPLMELEELPLFLTVYIPSARYRSGLAHFEGSSFVGGRLSRQSKSY